MTRHTGFERDDILGQWYPTDSVTAILDPAQGEPTVAALREAGIAEDQMHRWTGAEVVALIEEGTHDNVIKRTLRDIQRALTDDRGNLNVYERAARHGMDIVAVRAPDEATRQRVERILRDHFAHHIKFYGRFAITDLAP